MQPKNVNFEQEVLESFKRQNFMATLGVDLVSVAPGMVEMHLPYQENLLQQHGFFHGGVIGTLIDNACGYASYSLMGEKDSVLTVEYKVNLLSPGQGEKLIVRGQVIKPGRKLMVARADVYSFIDETEKHCATGQATLMVMENMKDSAA